MDNNELLSTTADSAQVNIQGLDIRDYATLDGDSACWVPETAGPELRTDIAWNDLDDLDDALRSGARLLNHDAATAGTHILEFGDFAYSEPVTNRIEYDMAGFGTDSVMQLDEGTKIAVGGRNMPDLKLNFAGYFSEADMEKVVSEYIGDSDAGIIQETRAIVFRYNGEVMAVTPEHYYTEVCFGTFEDGVLTRSLRPTAIRFVVKPDHCSLVWNCADNTQATKESLIEMDRAFDEVFD